MTRFEYWCALDEETKAELTQITDEKEIEDRFYKNLEFGTGGMRGKMGAGPNRMNKYTIAKATKGLADFLNASKSKKSVAIAYDSRNNSQYFSEITAGVLAYNGIKVFLFPTLMPTPVLSFAVRELSCDAGVVVTASHNPKEYNGYKVYDSEGCQLLTDDAKKLIGYVNAVEDIGNIGILSLEQAEEKGLLTMIDDSLLEKFIAECEKLSLYGEKSDIKIVYSPLHGSGNIPVRKVLKKYDVTIVKEQELPDGNFSTVRSPNPEEKDALTMAIEKAKTVNADIVIGTDPDCDRIGVAAKHNGDFVLLTGNQTGALLVDFVTKFTKFENIKNPAVVTTIVTGSLGADIAESRGCKIFRTLTGFKYIGDKMCIWDKNGEYSYIFGYEESYGYLAGTHARDKDAVSSAMLIAEMAAYHKNEGRTLTDALNSLYAGYGYYYDCLETVVLEGKSGAEKIQSVMQALRENWKTTFEDVKQVIDYSTGVEDLPKENVLKFIFNDGSWAAARPSGTEPKIKMYYSVKSENEEKAKKRQQEISSIILSFVE